MVETATEIEDTLNNISSGGYVFDLITCPKCDRELPVSNYTDRDLLLNHMIAHFYAKS